MSANTRKPGLGRGLGTLIQRTDPPPEPRQAEPGRSLEEQEPTPSDNSAHRVPAGSHFAEVPLTAIRPNPKQPRTVFDEDALEELVGSIQEVGLLQPVVVRPLASDGAEPRNAELQYELVMGERRWRACQAAGLDTIPAIVRETDEPDLLRDALLLQLHRAPLPPLAEAAAYQQMLEDFGCTQEELATRIKRSRPQISNTIRLLRLPGTVQRRVAAGVLSAGHARALLVVEDQAAQERLAQRIVAEGLSVRAVEELVTLGETGSEDRPRTKRNKPVAPKAVELGERLSDHFETRVKVDLGKTKGKISIDFATVDDLERIVAMMRLPDQETY